MQRFLLRERLQQLARRGEESATLGLPDVGLMYNVAIEKQASDTPVFSRDN